MTDTLLTRKDLENQLFCSDCISVMEEMNKDTVDFTLTDIPYDAVSRVSNGLRDLDKLDADIATFDLVTFCELVNKVTKNSICIFCGKEQFSTIFDFFARQKGTTRAVVWNKTNPSPMNGQYVYLSGVELAVWHKKSGARTFNAHCKNTVFSYPNGRRHFHPTEKNSNLFCELIEDNSNPEDIVFDPCLGSGTTALCAIAKNRRYCGIEISQKYFDIAKNRIEELTK